MEANCANRIPEPLLEDIFLAAGIDERYLRPISTVSKQLLSVSNRLKQTLHITPSNAHCLHKLLKRFPNIKHINLPFFFDPAKFFGEVSRYNISLESLDMSLMSTFPINKFKNLPLSSIQATLKSLKLSYVEDQTDVDGDLETLAELFPNMEELELFWRYKVSHNGVARLSSKLRRLRKVTIAGNSMVTDESIKLLVRNCLDLEEIVLNQCKIISPRGVSHAFRHCRKLKSVVLQKMCDIGNGGALALAHNLTSIEFSSMIVSDELLCAISEAMIPLTRVSLSNCTDFTLHGILLILGAYHWHLEYFAIEYEFNKWQLSPDSVDRIAPYLRNAKTVKLNYCCQLSTRQLLSLIHTCLKLSTLEVKGYSISQDQDQDPFTSQYDRKSQLRSLNLSFNATLSDLCLTMVSMACPYLSHLYVNGCKVITQMGLSQITRNCHELKTIQVNGCDGVSALGLEAKDLDCHELEVLEARGSILDDECLKLIALKCPGLMCLDVTNCQYVTGLGVREVAMRCKNLERLRVLFKCIDPDTEFFIRSKKPWLVNHV